MSKQANAMELSAWTTGAGIAIGTNVDIGGVVVGATATTVTLKVGTATLFDCSGASTVLVSSPAGITAGAVTGTSSGGSFAVLFKQRPA